MESSDPEAARRAWRRGPDGLRSWAAFAVFCAVSLGACRSEPLPAATLFGVEPNRAPPDVRVPVRIIGSGFSLRLRPSFNDDSEGVVGASFSATLGGRALGDVVFVDVWTLTATVPDDLPAGRHDLEVVDPLGARAFLAAAFEIEAPTPPTPPTATVTVAPTTGDLTTVFAASAEVLANGGSEPFTVTWDWQSDGVVDAEGATATHQYPAPGNYVVTVTVRDANGLSSTTTTTVEVATLTDLLVVTTALDENDPGASQATPGGAGFSLREALAVAAADSGAQTVLVPVGMVAAVDSPLPAFADPAGTVLRGAGSSIDGSAVTGVLLTLESDNNLLQDLTVIGGSDVVLAVTQGVGNTIVGCTFEGGDGIELAGNGTVFGPGNLVSLMQGDGLTVLGDARIEASRFADNQNDGVEIDTGAQGASLVGNVLVGNGRGLRVGRQSQGTSILHNVFAENLGDGLSMHPQADTVDCRNNAFFANMGFGLAGQQGSLAVFAAPSFFGNDSGDCNNCTLPGDALATDPAFVDPFLRDYRTTAASPLIDAGVDTGEDRNGDAPGLFFGVAPDIGVFELP